MPSSNAEVVKPMMLLTPAKSEVQSTLTSLAPLMISMEPSLENPLQRCTALEFNMLTATTCSTHYPGQGIDNADMFHSMGGLSAAITSPLEPVSILRLQLSAALELDKQMLHKCLTECFDEDISRTMPMFSLVPVGDDTEDVDMYVLLEEGLHHEWQPWPPQL